MGKTPVKLLSESGFKVGSTDNVMIMANDVGVVQKIKLHMT